MPPPPRPVRPAQLLLVIAKIKRASRGCVALLFRNGTAKRPNAGVLGGNGVSSIGM